MSTPTPSEAETEALYALNDAIAAVAAEHGLSTDDDALNAAVHAVYAALHLPSEDDFLVTCEHCGRLVPFSQTSENMCDVCPDEAV